MSTCSVPGNTRAFLLCMEQCCRLTFDTEGSWSMKYNMVWDKLLKWNLFSRKTMIAPWERQFHARTVQGGLFINLLSFDV